MWYGHGWWMGLSWILIAAVIIWVIWFGTRRGQRSDTEASAEELLRRRLANGDIDEDEYRQRLAVLKDRKR